MYKRQGEYYVTEFDSENKLLDEIFKTAPSEIICNDSFLVSGIDLEELHIRLNVVVSAVDNWHFDESKCEQALMEHFGVSSLDGLGLADYSIGITAAGAVMHYLTETQKTCLLYTSDPKQAKGLVKRAVVRIATPGTNLNTQSLDETKNNYLMCIVYTTNAYGVSYVDVTTGEYYVTEFDSENKLLDEIFKTAPSEIICNDSFLVSGIDLEELHIRLNVVVSAVDNWHFDESKCEQALMEHFGVSSLDGLGLADYSIGITAAGAVMQLSLIHI